MLVSLNGTVGRFRDRRACFVDQKTVKVLELHKHFFSNVNFKYVFFLFFLKNIICCGVSRVCDGHLLCKSCSTSGPSYSR